MAWQVWWPSRRFLRARGEKAAPSRARPKPFPRKAEFRTRAEGRKPSRDSRQEKIRGRVTDIPVTSIGVLTEHCAPGISVAGSERREKHRVKISVDFKTFKKK